MILIAHRGLFDGPDADSENRPEQIIQALGKGYDCEIDAWFKDGNWFLGHDGPEYEIDFDFLTQPGLWIHAKNLSALYIMGADNRLNFFWHENDAYTLTSHGYIWSFPKQQLTKNSIMLMPEWEDPKLNNTRYADCAGICSDYVEKIKSIVD